MERLSVDEQRSPSKTKPSHGGNLGTLRIRNLDTKEIILIPTPSLDPNDPLNWSKPRRYYLAILVCLAIFLCTFSAGGPAVAIVDMTETFFGRPGLGLAQQISKVAYFITAVTLLQGIGCLFWMPLVIKHGRRPVYLASFALFTVTTVWAAVADSYANELAARVVMGFAIGAGECLAPLTIADISFLHERGAFMAMYTATLSGGVAGGIVIAGLITIAHEWRMIYYVAIALVGSMTVLLFFTMPETSYIRQTALVASEYDEPSSGNKNKNTNDKACIGYLESGQEIIPQKYTFLQNLRCYQGPFTKEPILKMFFRPIGLLLLPPVLWATLVMSVTVGFLVAIASNFASAFATTYGFKPYQAGLCFISAIIGSLVGIAFGGRLTDWVAEYLTKRNDGIREPEMRLPAIAISIVTAPVSLVLYGAGINNQLHWMVPTLGLGLLNFSIVQAVNVSFVYTIDSYRPIGGEIMVTQLGFKACFAFFLSFYTNPWIERIGYTRAFCSMAAITGAILIMGFPLYFYGKQIRHSSLRWKALRFVRWNEDREMGE